MDSAKYNLGEIVARDTVKREIHFTNSGKYPLMLYNVTTSCGCTVANWPHKPILPGKSDVMEITFTEKSPLKFHKTINIFANLEKCPVQVTIVGKVIERKK